jgi:hypothetical protein
MQAILIGGPLHGARLPLETDDALMITPEEEWDGDEFLYVRRDDDEAPSPDTALFVHGHLTHDELMKAVEQSEFGDATTLRALDAVGRLRVITLHRN